MKRALLLSLLVVMYAFAAHAEEHTLLNPGITRVGGFGGPMVYYTTFNGDGNVLVGGQCGLTIDSKYYLGFFGAGIGHHPDAGNVLAGGVSRRTDLEMGYAGGLLGVILNSDDAMHVTADVIIGGGTVNRTFDDHNDAYDDGWDHHSLSSDAFFAVQPMAHAEVNIMRWMRADFGAGYRFVSGIENFGLENKDVSGPVAGVAFRFGKF